FGISSETLVPFSLRSRTSGALIPFDIGRFGNLERRVLPAEIGTRRRNFVHTERLAVRLGGPGALGRTLADYSFAADQARLVGDGLRRSQCGLDCSRIVPVHVWHDMPAIS